MSRFWISGAAVVLAIAALKTLAVTSFAPGLQPSVATVTGLFALFTILTAAVAWFIVTRLLTHLDNQRKERLAPGSGDPVAKETVVARYAPDWGLSQAEADVAIFVAKGFSNSEIADMRGCAIATVKSQLSKIYQKSGLESRYQLIAFVTDEVCAMANGPSAPEQEPVRVSTRKILPLVGRNKPPAANTDRDCQLVAGSR